jgi:predicted ABC-type ATPase
MNRLYIITGSCGAGKSSVIPFLKRAFPAMAVHDFDEVGVPHNPGIAWRMNATRHWLTVAHHHIMNGQSMILCGLILPQEVEELHHEDFTIRICLLDVIEAERAARLKKRNAARDVILDVDELYGLRKWVRESKYESTVIDTSATSPEDVSMKIVHWIDD